MIRIGGDRGPKTFRFLLAKGLQWKLEPVIYRLGMTLPFASGEADGNRPV
jgi:hypothetical protein